MTFRHFDRSLGCLVSPALDELATQLSFVEGLSATERDVITEATRKSLYTVLHTKVTRLLILELNAARVTGRLSGENSEQRWQRFLDLSIQRSFWDDLITHYPSLSRVGTIVRNRCMATLRFAQRWTTDRRQLESLCAHDPRELNELRFGAGDSHRGGSTVAIARGKGWRVVYKPRSLAIDSALRGFVAELAGDHGSAVNIRVPEAMDRGDYGWVEFVDHRFAAGNEELVSFYRGIGELLALMRLLSGSDLHAENVIAQGGSPVVVDCETLFTPKIPPSPSGYGGAFDRAGELIARTVLSVGLLPGRGVALGWRGVDLSAVGMLPGQQPMQPQLGIIGAGSDEAHVGTILVEAPVSQNHPSPRPALAEYWPEVLRGFDELTATLQRLDAAGSLRPRLRVFEDCRIRVVVRATEVYAEIGRMLWHPVSLHNPEPARLRAFRLLEKMAVNLSVAPSDPAVINAEIDDLLENDIPYFSTVVREGRLCGPGGTCWLPPCHLIEAALEDWRSADFDLEQKVIQASLVSAYINDGWKSPGTSVLRTHAHGGDLEARRRRQAAQIIQSIVTNAIHSDDGTVAWIAPVLTATGWSVQPLQQDLYNGISGLTLLLGAYIRETAAGRADTVNEVDGLFEAALHTLHLAETKRERLRTEGLKVRPLSPGAYLGLGSQIWTYIVLAHWELDGGDGLQRARKLADQVPAAAAVDDIYDLLSGSAGAIVPLLMLAGKTGDETYVRIASQLGDLLHERATHRNGQAYWTSTLAPEGMGGFAHGVTGIGWALTRLARATGNARYEQLAQEAFAFEDALFDEQEQNWLDLRMLDDAKTAAQWCHGAVGIGLAHLDLDSTLTHASTRKLVRRAAAATWRLGMGLNHCVCHGDLGAWELLDSAIAAGEAPKELTASYLLDIILTSLEQDGPSFGMGGNAFTPGLLPGVGGVAYQLLRAHPEHDLPSILTPGGDEI
ncbi:MAG: type 2 lantipeptide synthetase LanM family protein [Acidobacteria bacterium]|nr:type 2 lantipeptide synthetase LanM family protein [Acidobacteriota bacterium]MCA1627951.1 type 2 lantipeptide synthetase LanM family protein [Acidobacteriota bacterium]